MRPAAAGRQVTTPLPQVARLGFDGGWLVLGPHFLNLGRPVLLVDRVHIGPCATFGLEPFGSRDPHSPLPASLIEVDLVGSEVSLWTAKCSDRCLLVARWFDDGESCDLVGDSPGVALLVGDSYAVEASWSALWTCMIGEAPIQRVIEAS